MGDKVGSNMLARSPLAAFPLVHYSHGQHSVTFAIFFQDPEGRIRHSGAIGDGIAVDVDKGANLGKNFAVVGWNTNVNDDNEVSNPQLISVLEADETDMCLAASLLHEHYWPYF